MGARNLRERAAGLPDPAGRAAARDLVARIGRIHTRGWCEATSGNFSVVLSRDPLRLLITRSGLDKADVSPGDLLVVGEDGRPVSPDGGIPSAETLLHVTLARRAGAGAVLHTHSVWGTLLGRRFASGGEIRIRGYEMLKAFDGIETHDTEVRIGVLENTQDMTDLARRVETWLQGRPAAPGFLIAGHGLYAWGKSLDDAARHLEAFEFLFQVLGREARG